MKAVGVFAQEKRVAVVDHPEPRLSYPSEVKLRMLDVGICGTDREIVAGYGKAPEGSQYLILGHESLGEVVETGAEVSRFRVGDLAVISVRRPCTHSSCIACREGRPDFCYTGDYTERGIKSVHGFMAEYVVDEEKWLTRLPSELRDIGVLIEPLTIAEKALIQVHDVQERLPWACSPSSDANPAGDKSHSCHRALVLGAGPVGFLGAMLFRAAGFETWMYSRTHGSADKAQLAESFGARLVPTEEVSPQQLLDRIGQIDFVYEAVGGAPVAFDVLKLLGPNGIFIFTGVPGRKAPLPLDVDVILGNMVAKNQVVLGTVNAGPDAFQAAVRDLGKFQELWPDAVRGLITARVPLRDAPELLRSKSHGIKQVVSPPLAD